MKQMIWAVACTAAGLACQSLALAQERIYRCGNEYTNNAALAKQRNCPAIEGGYVTVVHNPPATPSSSAGAEAKPVSGSSGDRVFKVDPGQQKARDNDARSILQAELAKAQERLQKMKLEFNDGNPNKSALELRNPQVFNERVEQLKASIARQESDVAGIQRELERHPGG